MINDLIKVEDRVLFLLEKYPQTRESDKYLWLAYCVNYCNLKLCVTDYSRFKNWLLSDDIPVFESLSRARRKIMEKNEAVRPLNYRARQAEEKAVREWAKE